MRFFHFSTPWLKLVILVGWLSSGHCKSLTISEERHKYLKATSIGETGFEPANLKAIINILLRDVIQEEPELAADLVFHTDRLIRHDQATNRESFFNEELPLLGRTHLADFIDFFEQNNESLNTLGVLVRTYRRDYNHQLQYSGQRSETRSFALFSHFLNLGGNYDAFQAMDLLQRDLRLACGDGISHYLAPHFFDLAYHLRPAQRQRIVQWAEGKKSDPGVTASTTAQAVLLGFSLFEKTEKVAVGEPAIPRGASLDSQLLDVIQNSSLSLLWRVGFASLMSEQFPQDLAPFLRVETANLLSTALENHLTVPTETRIHILNAFLLGRNEDGGWLDAASRLASATELSGDLSSAELIRSPALEQHWITQKLDLLYRAGKTEAAHDYLYQFSLNSHLYPSLWITLVANRKFDLANQLFFAHAQTTPYHSLRFQLYHHYTQRLAAALPDYLKTLADPKDRALAELLIIAVPDPAKRDRNHSKFHSIRQDRFRDYAEAYHSNPPRWNRDQQLRVGEIFSLSEGIPWMSQWLRNREIGLVARIQQTDPKIEPYWAARLEMHHAAELLEAGQSLPLLMMWGRSVEEEHRILETRRRYLTDALIGMVDARIESALRQKDFQRARKILPFARQLLGTYPEKVPNQVNPRLLHQLTIKTILGHALCEEINTWNTAWDSMDPARKNHLVSLLKRHGGFLPTVIDLLNPERNPPHQVFPAADRIAIFSGLFQAEWVDQGLPAFSILSELTAGGLLEESDLAAMAESLSKKAPREGSSWREYLGTMADRRSPREVIPTIDREIDQQNQKPNLQNALKVEKLLILKSLKMDAEVRKLEMTLPTRELKLPREYQAVVNGLKLR